MKLYHKAYIIILSVILGILSVECTPDKSKDIQKVPGPEKTVLNKDSLIKAGKTKAKPVTATPENEEEDMSETEDSQKISPSDAFIRTIVQKNKINKEQTTEVRLRLYTKVEIADISSTVWPEFKDFEVSEVALDSVRQMKQEIFKNQKYNVLDLRTVKLKPKKAGALIIEPTVMKLSFNVPSGKKVKTFFGKRDITTEVRKVLKSETVTINVVEG